MENFDYSGHTNDQLDASIYMWAKMIEMKGETNHPRIDAMFEERNRRIEAGLQKIQEMEREWEVEVAQAALVMEKPKDVFPELRKTWTMEVCTRKNKTSLQYERVTTYTSPDGKVSMNRWETSNRFGTGKWKCRGWMICVLNRGRWEFKAGFIKTRREAARTAMDIG